MHPRHAARAAGAALLAVASIALSTGCHIPLQAEEARDQWKKSYTIRAGGTLEIRNTNGKIQVDPSDGPTVEVIADRIARATTQDDAKDALKSVTIRESVSADRVELETARAGPGYFLHVSQRVDYVVRVPKGLNVTLTATNGEIVVSALSGTARLRTTNGRIRALDVGGPIEAEATNGDVKMDVAALSTNGIRCETTNGEIEITLPAAVKAELELRTNNGGIDTMGLDLAASEKTRRELRATAGGGGPLVRLQTTNGGIRVRGR